MKKEEVKKKVKKYYWTFEQCLRELLENESSGDNLYLGISANGTYMKNRDGQFTAI